MSGSLYYIICFCLTQAIALDAKLLEISCNKVSGEQGNEATLDSDDSDGPHSMLLWMARRA